MTFVFIYIALVFLSCSCEDEVVNAIALLNENGTVVETPSDLVKTRLLITNLDTNNTDQSPESQQMLPAVTSFEVNDTDEVGIDNLDVCARTKCSKIYCPNSLPPIPSQGICCPRCIKNPNCNANTCPQYKCSTYLIPANLTAGECCDRCARTTNQPKDESSESQSTSSSSSEEDEEVEIEESSSSSSDEDSEDRSIYKTNAFKAKQHRIQLRLIRLLSKTLSELRQSRSHRKY